MMSYLAGRLNSACAKHSWLSHCVPSSTGHSLSLSLSLSPSACLSACESLGQGVAVVTVMQGDSVSPACDNDRALMPRCAETNLQIIITIWQTVNYFSHCFCFTLIRISLLLYAVITMFCSYMPCYIGPMTSSRKNTLCVYVFIKHNVVHQWSNIVSLLILR